MSQALISIFLLLSLIQLAFPLRSIATSDVQVFLQDLTTVESSLSASCLSGLSNFTHPDLVAQSYTLGTTKDYSHIDHHRWMFQQMSCAKSSGGHGFSLPEEKLEFCYAHFPSGETAGVCIPEMCEDSSELFLEQWVQQFENTSDLALEQSPKCISSQWKDQWYEKLFPIMDTFLQFTLFCLLIIGTIYEHNKSKSTKKQSTLQKLLISFSLKENSKRLAQLPSDPKTIISCMFGLRTLSTMWTIVGHSYMSIIPFLGADDIDTQQNALRTNIFAHIFTNFSLCVDTFFLLSGSVTAFSFFRKVQNLRPGEEEPGWRTFGFWVKFYRHRLLRLLPAYIYVLITIAARYSIIHYHPTWPTVDASVQCRSHWWENLLFINSILPNRCLPWMWYLGDDFIYYLFAPIFLLTLKDYPKAGAALVSAVICLSASLRALLVHIFNYPPTASLVIQPTEGFNPDFVSQHVDVYIKPYTRVGPYLVGILLGHLLQQHKKTPESMHIGLRLLGWSASCFGGLWAVFGLYPVLNGLSSSAYTLVYAAVNRTVFSVAVSWVVYACYIGQAGLLNWFLSCRPFVVLGNLSYGTYLFHLMPIGATYLNSNFPIKWNGFGYHSLVYIPMQVFFGYATGWIVCMCVELPCMNMERMFLGKSKKKSDKPKLRPPVDIPVEATLLSEGECFEPVVKCRFAESTQ